MAFDEALNAADQYASDMQKLHEALAAARVSFMAASMSVQQRYGDLGQQCIPKRSRASRIVLVANQEATVSPPSFTFEPRTDDAIDEDDGSVSDSDDDDVAAAKKVTGRWSAEREKALWRADPVMWFTTAPPQDLYDAQRAFIDVLNAAAAVATSKGEALRALTLAGY